MIIEKTNIKGTGLLGLSNTRKEMFEKDAGDDCYKAFDKVDHKAAYEFHLDMAKSYKRNSEVMLDNKDRWECSQKAKRHEELSMQHFELMKGGPGSGPKIGMTRSGKTIYADPKHESHKQFTHSDHVDAYLANRKGSKDTSNALADPGVMYNKESDKHKNLMGKLNQHGQGEEHHAKEGRIGFIKPEEESAAEKHIGYNWFDSPSKMKTARTAH